MLTYVCMQGIIQAVIGPTLPELTFKFQTTYDEISFAIGAKGKHSSCSIFQWQKTSVISKQTIKFD